MAKYNPQDLVEYLKNPKPTSLHAQWGEERYRPVAEEANQFVLDPGKFVDFALQNNINSVKGFSFLESRNLNDQTLAERFRLTKEKNVFANAYSAGKDIYQLPEFKNVVYGMFKDNKTAADAYFNSLSTDTSQKNAITKRILDSYGIQNTVADTRHQNILNFKPTGDGSYIAADNDNRRFNPSVWELADSLYNDYMRGYDVTRAENFKNAPPAVQKAALEKLGQYYQNPADWAERAKHEGFQAYQSGNFTPLGQRFKTPQEMDDYFSRSGAVVPTSFVDAAKAKDTTMTKERWDTLDIDLKERYIQEHGQPQFDQQGKGVFDGYTPPQADISSGKFENGVFTPGSGNSSNAFDASYQSVSPEARTLFETAFKNGFPADLQGQSWWQPVPDNIRKEAWSLISKLKTPEGLADFVISKGLTNVQQYGWWNSNPNKDQAWAIVEQRQKGEGSAGASQPSAPGSMANPSRFAGANADQLFEAIKSGQLVPGQDPGRNAEWVSLYQNGAATGTQKTAYQMWDAYNKYSGLGPNLLFAAIRDGQIRPDPNNPAWRALYVNGQPTPAQMEAYSLWDAYNKKQSEPSPDTGNNDPGNIDNFDSADDYYDYINNLFSSDGSGDDVPTRGGHEEEPSTKTLEEMYNELSGQYKLDDLTSEVNDWNKQIADEQSAFRMQRNNEMRKQVPMSVIAGRVGEEERAYMERVDFYQRQRDTAQSILEGQQHTIDTLLKYRSADQQNALEMAKEKRQALDDYFKNMIALKKEQREEGKDQQTQARDAIKILVDNFGGQGFAMVDQGTLAQAGFSGLDVAVLAKSMTAKERSDMLQAIDTPFGAYMYAILQGDAATAQKAQDWMMMQKNAGTIDSTEYLDGTDTIVPGSVSQIDGSSLTPDILANCVKYIRSLNLPGFPQSGLLSLDDKINVLFKGPNGSKYPVPGAVGIMDYGKIDPESKINYGHVFYVETVTKDKITISQTNVPGGKFKRETLSINDPRIKGFWVSSSAKNTKTGGFPSVDSRIPIAYANWAARDKKQSMEDVAEELASQFEYSNKANKIVVKNYIIQKFSESEKLYEKVDPGVFQDFIKKFAPFIGKPKYDWSTSATPTRKLSNEQIAKLINAGMFKPEYADKNLWEIPVELIKVLDSEDDDNPYG